ncbi:MAG: DoxX family membrane protein [Verrucomicrobia bacterium]|nr:DoxX family membrane protein [Verrucomicrobiota bacterium]
MRRWRSWLACAARCALGCGFLYAGMVKFQDPGAFAGAIAAFQLLPPAGVEWLAGSLPSFEILLGALLLTGWQLPAAALAATLLASGFAAALGLALARGLVVDCGCFGEGAPSIRHTWVALGRDIVVLIAACWLYRVGRAGRALAPVMSKGAADPTPS